MFLATISSVSCQSIPTLELPFWHSIMPHMVASDYQWVKRPTGGNRMDTQLHTTTEVATILGTNPKTLSNWRTAGIGPRFVKIGSHVRYRT